MTPFLLVYLSVYTLLHYYAFRKIRAAFLPGKKIRLGITLFMAAMIAAPIMVRMAERAGIETGARFWAYASFSWMGLLFLFLTLTGTVDLIRLAILAAEKIRQQKFTQARVSPRQLFAAQAIVVVALYGYGLFEATDIRQEHIEIISPKITEKTGRIRIAQISDVHLGLLVRESRLKKILAEIRKAKPDILVSTGDLVDGQPSHLNREARLLAALNPPLGKIAITGNHEFYAGLQVASAFMETSGFTLLRQQGMAVGGINFVGVDDPVVKNFARKTSGAEHEILSAQAKENFTVLLKHRPEINPYSSRLFDLQLSGHTHKGQIFPFNLFTWFFYPQRAGQLTSLNVADHGKTPQRSNNHGTSGHMVPQLAASGTAMRTFVRDPDRSPRDVVPCDRLPLNSGFLYLSRGTGTWGPPIRFLAPPEVTIIDLLHGE